MQPKTDTDSDLPKTSAALSALVRGLRHKNATLRQAHETLQALGCSVHAVALRKEPISDKDGLLDKVFVAPARSMRDVVRDGLATICDTYGRRRKIYEHRVALVLALSIEENWRACIEPGHDPHALAVNSLVALRCVTAEFGFSGAIMGMLNQWLREGISPIEADSYFFEYRWDRAELEATILRAMFGDAWWVLSGNPSDKLVDLSFIMRDRPQFLPGLTTGLHTGFDYSAELLPEML